LLSWPALLSRLHGSLPGMAVVGAWVLALSMSGWIVAGWFWTSIAPATLALLVTPSADTLVAGQTIASRHLLGSATAAATPGATRQVGSYRLLGAMTGNGHTPGFAVLGEEGKPPQSFVEGEEIAPGATLYRVLAKAIEIRRQDGTEHLNIVEK
jgi:hypothetical protein